MLEAGSSVSEVVVRTSGRKSRPKIWAFPLHWYKLHEEYSRTTATESTLVLDNVSQSPASLTVREGETINLTCTLSTTANVEEMRFIWKWGTSSTTCSATADESILWQCNQVPDPRVLVTTDLQTKSSEFRITRALLNYSGTYKCEVVIISPLPILEFYGSDSVVLVEESPLTVSQFPSLLPVAEGEDARLTCVLQQAAADVRNLSFTWVTDRAEVSCPVVASGRESNRCDGLDPRVSVAAHILNKSSILTIKEASVTDNGTYRCQVTFLNPPRNQTMAVGDGSVVLVLERTYPHPALYVPLAVVSAILLSFLLPLLACFLVKKSHEGSPQQMHGLGRAAGNPVPAPSGDRRGNRQISEYEQESPRIEEYPPVYVSAQF
ncbi:uncharacterized protein LOC127586539 isoform X2 [Pristis pectinata]|uniref:uncharacterized protein LOC127586539 isoform X2 n=1 Tax=Pristis pectinata TaxID=685728 RepID=UPI00223CFFAE|nr:uncharacterized protein LOC127586539 isoform X2 [Pristis pectinata]